MGLVVVCVGCGCRSSCRGYDCNTIWGGLSVESKCGCRWFGLWWQMAGWFVGWSIVVIVDSVFVVAYGRLMCLGGVWW